MKFIKFTRHENTETVTVYWSHLKLQGILNHIALSLYIQFESLKEVVVVNSSNWKL